MISGEPGALARPQRACGGRARTPGSPSHKSSKSSCVSFHQRHKPAAFEKRYLGLSSDFANQLQFLTRGRTDRHHHASTLAQLSEQGWRHFGGRGRNKNGIERNVLRPTLAAIPDSDLHVAVSQPMQRAFRRGRQLCIALHRIHLGAEQRKQRRHVPGTSSDFEYALSSLITGLKIEMLEHGGYGA